MTDDDLELRKGGKSLIVRYSQTMFQSSNVVITVQNRWHAVPGLLALIARHSKIKIRRITLWGGLATSSTVHHTGQIIVARSFGIPVANEIIRIPVTNMRPYALLSYQFINGSDSNDIILAVKDDPVWSVDDAPEIQPHPPGHSFGMIGLSMFVKVNTATVPQVHAAAYVTVDHIVTQRRTADRKGEYGGVQEFEDSHDHILPHIG